MYLVPMAGWTPGAPEIILIIVVIVLLFGAKKLPDLARGSGRALRIFKAETKGLVDDDDEQADRPQQLPGRPEDGSRPAGDPDSRRTPDA